MAKSKKRNEIEISIMELDQGEIEFFIKGKSPMICNAMSAKAQKELLMPAPKKNAAEKASHLKHNPLEEYRNSVYYARDPDSGSRIVQPATCFKNALRGAALDLPGSNKSQMGRLTYIKGDEIAIYGVPELLMSITRLAGASRAPDIRTRAILPEWACHVTVLYTKPILKSQAIINLMAAAGIMQGIGDWRVEKGSGNYGQFEIIDADDQDWHRIVAEGGKDAQDAALKEPTCYNSETEELLNWFNVEAKRRGFKVVA